MYKILHIETGEYLYRDVRGDLFLKSSKPWLIGVLATYVHKETAINVFTIKEKCKKFNYPCKNLVVDNQKLLPLTPENRCLFEIVEF